MLRLFSERVRGGRSGATVSVEKLNNLNMALFGEAGQRCLLKLMLVKLLSCSGAGRPFELGSGLAATV